MLLRFVPFDQIFRFYARGWVISSTLRGRHGDFSVLMKAQDPDHGKP